MMINKEKRGILDVIFGDRKATPIYKDVEAIEDAVIEYLAMYVKGYHSNRNDRGFGAEHIKLHLEKRSEGEISIEELVNVGNSLREYLKNFKEPFIDEKSAKIYEWESKREGDNCHSTPFTNAIITFYSDRNLSQRMEFKNPKVKEYYEHLESQITRSETSNHSIKIQNFNNQDSIKDRIALLEKNQQAIINTPKTNTIQEIEKQESTINTDSSIKQQNAQRKLK